MAPDDMDQLAGILAPAEGERRWSAARGPAASTSVPRSRHRSRTQNRGGIDQNRCDQAACAYFLQEQKGV
jgi:hypothetical protein